MKPVRIGIMTTLWEREELNEIVLRYYYDLEVEGVHFVRQAAGSEGLPSMLQATRNAWYYTEVPNRPLGQKHNLALQALCSHRPDCIVIIGSDDLISREYFELVRDLYREGVEAIRIDGLYYYDLKTDETYYADKAECGAGRMLSYGLCRKRKFKAWPDDREKYMDGSMHTQILQYADPRKLRDQRKHGFAILDIKSGTNIWSREEMDELINERNRYQQDTDEIFNTYFPGVLEKLRTIKQPRGVEESGEE